MFAVIDINNRQYKISKGDILMIDKLNLNVGEEIVNNRIQMLYNNHQTIIGTPYLEDWRVSMTVVENLKMKKIKIFKKRRRKNSRRMKGHRQQMTLVQIMKIELTH